MRHRGSILWLGRTNSDCFVVNLGQAEGNLGINRGMIPSVCFILFSAFYLVHVPFETQRKRPRLRKQDWKQVISQFHAMLLAHI
jgi:hypothetical protein